MANHRASRHQASRTDSAQTGLPPTAGKRKATKSSRAAQRQSVVPQRRETRGTRVAPRSNPLAALPSAPSLVGAAALLVAATGAVSLGQGGLAHEATAGGLQRLSTQASVLSGAGAVVSADDLRDRELAVSRDSRREALETVAEQELQEAAEAQAEERNAALAELAANAQKHADEIAENAWVLPIQAGVYELSAHFGESSSYWASTHTGLDFAAPSGTPVMSVAGGVVTSTGYDGSYGNKVVVTLDDGTEIWFCHLTSFAASPGDAVGPGEVVGYVGSTGNSTGPHLHLEVRPGAGDPVDPMSALMYHGLQP